MQRSQAFQVYDEYAVQKPATVGTPLPKSRTPRDALPPSPSQQWLDAVCSAAERQGQAALFVLLRGRARQATDRTVPTLNRARSMISKVFAFTTPRGDRTEAPDPQAPLKARTCLYLYQRALHEVLLLALRAQVEMAGLDAVAELPPEARDATVVGVLEEEEMQLGLIHACLEIVNYAQLPSHTAAFPAITLRLGRLPHALELWRGLRWVQSLLSQPAADGVPAMPAELMSYMDLILQRLLEEVAFAPGSSLYTRLKACSGAHPTEASPFQDESEEEEAARRSAQVSSMVLTAFLRTLVRLAMTRCEVLCVGLCKGVPALAAPGACPAFFAACAALLDWLLCSHMDILFGQHLSVVVVAAIYFTARVHAIEGVSIRRLSAIALELLPCHDEDTFGRVELAAVSSATDKDDALQGGGGEGEGALVGSCRQYYNAVLLPMLQPHTPQALFGSVKEALEAALAASAPSQSFAADDGTRGENSPCAWDCAGGSQPDDLRRLTKARGKAEAAEGGVAGGDAKAAKPGYRRPLGAILHNQNRNG